ncbi:helix-turn-helix domain-containing protein [Aeromonas enteropelogenes]|uniref:helix-turn-helix domain-containing protein n=1 Tax=Aeromonas enteropelogenes TaxID=29489 RepID=UPI0038D0C6D3
MIGERVKRARAAAGLSMQALGDKVGVSANMVKKYEHDQSMPSSAVLLKLAAALSVRTEFFFRPSVVTLANVEYRKRSTTPAKIIQQIEGDVLDQAERWKTLADLWPNFPIPSFSYNAPVPMIHRLDDIEAFADSVREHWQLGVNPIPNLIDLLETKGILVIVTKVEQSNKFDGLQAHIGEQPVVVVSAHWPGCRQRFTLAHELGHLLMHGKLPADMEEEQACNRFAGAFLFPKAEAIAHLGETRRNLEPKELYFLKHEYGLSMAACLYRAKHLNIITEARCKDLYFKYFVGQKWRSGEPGTPYPQEHTWLFQQLVYRALSEEIISESKAAELLQMPLLQLRKSRIMQGEAM